MPRWTLAENEWITSKVLNQPEEPDYVQWLIEHIDMFKISRSYGAYKTHVKKIAKENNIEWKSPTRWTEEEKTIIQEMVHENPLDPDWEGIAKKLNRSEASVYTMYNTTSHPKERVEASIHVIDKQMIVEWMSTIQYKCINCSVYEYTSPFIWKENPYCESCFIRLFKEEVDRRWEYIRDYSIATQKTACNLCGKKARFDRSLGSRFHYDHIDMFDKTDSVCSIVSTGKPIEDAEREIDKCQLLCVSCHKLITQMEQQCGFVRLKKHYRKEYMETENKEKHDSLTKEYSMIYKVFMEKIYSIVKENYSSA